MRMADYKWEREEPNVPRIATINNMLPACVVDGKLTGANGTALRNNRQAIISAFYEEEHADHVIEWLADCINYYECVFPEDTLENTATRLNGLWADMQARWAEQGYEAI